MAAQFSFVERHIEAPFATVPAGRLVLSRLGRGESPIFCATPAIKYVVDGEERYEVDGVQHLVLPGQFLLVEAGTRLRAILPQRSCTTGMCIYLKAGEAMPHVDLATADERARAAEAPGGRAIVLNASGTQLGAMLGSTARTLAGGPGADGRGLAENVVMHSARLLDPVLSNAAQRLEGINARKPATRRDLLRKLEMVRAYLHDHDHRAVPLDELAAVAGLSQFHLLRSFAAAYGMPPASFHRHERLRKADALLRSGTLDMSGAAERFGFADERSLRRAQRRRRQAGA